MASTIFHIKCAYLSEKVSYVSYVYAKCPMFKNSNIGHFFAIILYSILLILLQYKKLNRIEIIKYISVLCVLCFLTILV